MYYKENNLFFLVYIFTPNSAYFEKLIPNIIKEMAETYGDSHNNLSGLDASKIGEVIPDFHNTQKKIRNFLKAVEVNCKNRKELCKKEIDDIMSFKDKFFVINDCIEKKEINYTVTPKITLYYQF